MKRVAWILVAIGAAVIGALVLGASAFLHKESKSVAALEQAQARAKKLGIPVYASQLRALQIPDEDNAWVDLEKVSELEKAGNFSDSQFQTFPKLWDINDEQAFVDTAGKALPQWKLALGIVRAATKKSGFYPKLEWENGAALLRPDLVTDKRLLKDLLTESRFYFFKGQHDKSIGSLKTAARLVSLLRKDHTELGFLVSVKGEDYIANDVIGQARSTHDAKAISDLHSVLNSLYPSIPIRNAFEFETVLFVESVRMSSSDSKTGNELRASIKPEDRPLIPTASFTSPSNALLFETKAINRVCAYYNELNDDPSAYLDNDVLYNTLLFFPFSWVNDGFPIGFARLISQLETAGYVNGDGPYASLAKRELSRQIYQKAFDIVTGTLKPKDGETWPCAKIKSAEMTYSKTPHGFEIDVTAPDLSPVKLKFPTK